MIAKFWWVPLCISCLTLAVLGQLTKIPDSPQYESLGGSLGSPSFHAKSGPTHETTKLRRVDDGKERKERTDPHLFVDWPENPDFVLFVSGRQNGYIEPCGCTGLENQKGGLMRRHQFMKELEAKHWLVVPIDAGNQVRRFGIQPTLKLGKTFEALCQVMGYQAIGFGPDDLKLPTVDVLQNMLNGMGNFNPFVSANVVLMESAEFSSPYRVIEIGNRRIFVTMVLGQEYIDNISTSDLSITDVETALQNVILRIKAEKCDTAVLVAYTSIEASEQLAKQFPHFDIVVTSGGDGEPTLVPERVETGNHITQIIQTGAKGMHVGVVGFYSDNPIPIRYQRVPMDDRFVDSPEITAIFKDYQKQLESLGLSGMSIQPIAHPSGRRFIGSDACWDCHSDEWEIWRHGVTQDEDEVGPHSRATLSLTEPTQRVTIQRHFDPECLSCHVTGWNPQGYFPYLSGYERLDSEVLHGNGCENCHGPAYEHVKAELGEISATDAELQQLRQSLRITLDQARESLCIECHDLDNSPDFHHEGAFEEYWEKIKH
ncbi:MAG TPA: multiheme c-type cytochrome [Pirellulaceae bacterium]|nr:multiheme c-type cytochrome [Pirellulaceae bacterium]HMP67858.1 multiheme c-type cytochrome [Pirellulaceae bacterium]